MEKAQMETNRNNIYKEFDYRCQQLGLTEIYLPTNKSQYERLLLLLQNNKVKCTGYMDDFNCKFEIRFR